MRCALTFTCSPSPPPARAQAWDNIVGHTLKASNTSAYAAVGAAAAIAVVATFTEAEPSD